ncbi:MAG TPA: hypothetical protein VF449_10760 [Parvibaculum sp.]
MRFVSQIIKSPFDLLHYATIGRVVPRTHILVACMPKSGSTYLSNTISRLPGFRKATLVRQYGRVEQDLDIETVLRKHRYDYVAQHHVKYNENTRFMIDRFDIKPVVLVRNIFDCVVSIRDHLRRESTISPSAWFDARHAALPDRELESMIAHLAIPWYINFYVSWMHCPEKLVLTYDEAVGDTLGSVTRICVHFALNFDTQAIERAVTAGDPGIDRRNVGQNGRGASLDEETKALIRRFGDFHPDIDFSPIGLD